MKYWKTTIVVTVLTAGDTSPEYMGLDAVAYDIREGDASGAYTVEHSEVTEQAMAELLKAQGSDPEFLIPTV